MENGALLDTIGNTPLVELCAMSPKEGVRIYAKLEGQNPTGSLKDRIAKNMIEKAEREGNLDPNVTILEPTSGNTGISLALVARLKGYKIKVVMPDSVSPERTQLLEAYGAEIIYSEGRYGSNGAIALAQEIMSKSSNGNYFMPYQYGNEANPEAHYKTTGAEIVRDLPEVDVFIAGLGTGGTLMGVGRRLKEHRKDIKIVAVAPEPDEAIQGLRDLEEGFIPPILDLSLLDSRVMAKSIDAFRGTRELMRREGIFAGISSGSVIWAAMKVAESMDKGNIVCLLADGGWKYLSTGLWTKDSEQMEREARGKIWW
ncbi:MAG: cysteine synthase [Dehalococcoidia bacterium]|nr:cysteine synthase [Chloroflexota bacterium]